MTEESARRYREIAWPEFVDSHDVRSHEYQMVKKGGERADVVLAARPLRDASGSLQRSLSVLVDVTERKRAEEQLRRAQKLEALGRMTGTVAHDFNNLLMVIGGNLELLRERATEERQIRMLQAAQRSVERGEKLTQQLLAFSRRQPLRPELVAVNDLLAEMAPLLRQAVGGAVEISLDFVAALPPCRIDPTQFGAAVLNLAVNARDAMPRGGALTLSTRAAGAGWIELAVRDTGQGMPADVLERVFEPFFTTKPGGKGSGLGLAQVYGFAQQSGGEARVESTPGGGTTVRLLLPAAARAPEPSG
jgi:signal transduction histidine kinase